jgi:hypothetical protein
VVPDILRTAVLLFVRGLHSLTLADEAPTVFKTFGNYRTTELHIQQHSSTSQETETVEKGKMVKIGYCIVKELFVKDPAEQLYLHSYNPV